MGGQAWFPLVLRIVRIGDFYDLPTSGIFTTNGNTPSQTCQTVGDFYDVIGRIGSISTFEGTVCPRRSSRSAIFTMSVNMKFACLGRSPTSAIFTMSVNMKFACLGHRGCLILPSLATKARFSVNYKCIILSTAANS